MNSFHAYNLKRRFERNNPGDSDLIDWDTLGSEETYDENLELIQRENPGFDWGSHEDYDEYYRGYLREEAEKAGLRFTNIRTATPTKEPSLNHFLNLVAQDIKQSHILFLSEAGHGKSSSLKTIVKHCMENDPSLTFKIVDNSLAWYHNTPTRYVQTVNAQTLNAGRVQNLCNCTYEVGELTEDQQRGFTATIIYQDYVRRYNMEKNEPEQLDKEPWIIYVVEESNISWGSYSLRKNDEFTEPLKVFTSVGRNLKMRAIFVSTACVGELSPSIRRRTRKIYGKIISESDLAMVRRHDKNIAKQLRKIPRYHFIYHSANGFTQPTQIPDTCNNKPITPNTPTTQTTINTPKFDASWWLSFGAGIGITILFLLYFI